MGKSVNTNKQAIDDQKRAMMHDDLNRIIDWINNEIEKFENTPGENHLDRSTRIKRFNERYSWNLYPLYTLSARLTTGNFAEIKMSFPLSLVREVKEVRKETEDTSINDLEALFG